jgi:ubiquinone/menaquinone biosynthesis C-methylase UbiE
MREWEESVHPFLYDLSMRLSSSHLDSRRRAVVAGARGRILELGVGTGQNLRFYDRLAQVTGVDPDSGMMRRARPRSEASPARVRLVAARGEQLPFPDATFDEVVATLVL